MSRLRKNVFGIPVGKVGHIVFKTRKGKTYIATEPIFTKPRESPKVIENNKKFALFAKITPQLQSDPRIRTIWETSEVKGDTARHKISSFNFRRIDSTGDLTSFRLVPLEKLFPAEITSAEWLHGILRLTFAPFELTNMNVNYPILSVHGMVRFYGNVNPMDTTPYLINKVSSSPVQYRKGESHTFDIEWSSDLMNRFTGRQFCLTVIVDNDDGIPAECSVSVVV